MAMAEQPPWTSRFKSRRVRLNPFLVAALKKGPSWEMMSDEEQMKRIIRDATKVFPVRSSFDDRNQPANRWLQSAIQPDLDEQNLDRDFDQMRPARELRTWVLQQAEMQISGEELAAQETEDLQQLMDELQFEKMAMVLSHHKERCDEAFEEGVSHDRLTRLWRQTLEVFRSAGKLEETQGGRRLDVPEPSHETRLEFYVMFQTHMMWQRVADDCAEFLEWTEARAEHRTHQEISCAPKSDVGIDEMIAVLKEIDDEVSSGDAAGNLESYSLMSYERAKPLHRPPQVGEMMLDVGKRWHLIKKELGAISTAYLRAASRLAAHDATDDQRQWLFERLMQPNYFDHNPQESAELLKLFMPDSSSLLEGMDVLSFLRPDLSDDPTLLEYLLTHQRQVFAPNFAARTGLGLDRRLVSCVYHDSAKRPRLVDTLIKHGIRFSPDFDTSQLYTLLKDHYSYYIQDDPAAPKIADSGLLRVQHVAIGLGVSMDVPPPLPEGPSGTSAYQRDPAAAALEWELGGTRLTWLETCILATAVCDLGCNLRFPAVTAGVTGTTRSEEQVRQKERLKRSVLPAMSRESALRFLGRAAVNMEALRFLVVNGAPIPRPEMFGALLQKYALPTLFATLHMFVQQGKSVVLPEFSPRADSNQNLAMFPRIAGLICHLLRRCVPNCPRSYFDELQRIHGSLSSAADVLDDMGAVVELDRPADWECLPASADESSDLMESLRSIIVSTGKDFPELKELFVEYAATF